MTDRRRMFSETSFWNQPIADEAEIDSRSDYFMGLWAKEPTGGLHINASEFAIPVYDVDHSTPRKRMRQKASTEEQRAKSTTTRKDYSHFKDFEPMIPIPDGAIPDPENDHHVAFVDWKRGLAWDMWGAWILPDGTWESYTAMQYSIDGDGVFERNMFDTENGDSIHFHGPGRAAGVPIIAGLAMHHEIMAGKIEHKLAFAARYNAYQEFTFPATWTDGRYPGGLPEGAVVQLDPELDLDRFDLNPGARVIAETLQKYGMVNVDGAAGTCVYLEGIYGHPEWSWDGQFDEDELKQIPVDRFRVLKLENVIPMGDARTHVKQELPR